MKKLIVIALLVTAGCGLAVFVLVPERTQVGIAALSDSACYASLSDAERDMFGVLHAGGKLWRAKETRLRRNWMLDGGLSVLQVATVAYSSVTSACRTSILGLLDAYLANGADIDMISDARRQWTVLQGAIVMADPALTCALLKRGASLDVKFAKPGFPIDGLDGFQMAQRGVETAGANADRRRVVEVIERFRDSGRCAE